MKRSRSEAAHPRKLMNPPGGDAWRATRVSAGHGANHRVKSILSRGWRLGSERKVISTLSAPPSSGPGRLQRGGGLSSALGMLKVLPLVVRVKWKSQYVVAHKCNGAESCNATISPFLHGWVKPVSGDGAEQPIVFLSTRNGCGKHRGRSTFPRLGFG